MVLPADNHVMLVQRMLGSSQLGTGGSSGYLCRTIFPFITVVIPAFIIVLGVVIIKQLDIFNHLPLVAAIIPKTIRTEC